MRGEPAGIYVVYAGDGKAEHIVIAEITGSVRFIFIIACDGLSLHVT